MTVKRFKFICDDEKCFFKDGNKALYCYEVVDILNSLSDENEQLKHRLAISEKANFVTALEKENEQLRKDLIDHSALISMLEDYQALKIEDTLYNLTGAESEEEFNELYKPYLDKAKKCWKGDWE